MKDIAQVESENAELRELLKRCAVMLNTYDFDACSEVIDEQDRLISDLAKAGFDKF